MKSSTTIKGIEVKEYPDKTYEEVEQMVKEETEKNLPEKNLRKVFKERGLSDDEIDLKIEQINAHIQARKVVKHGK